MEKAYCSSSQVSNSTRMADSASSSSFSSSLLSSTNQTSQSQTVMHFQSNNDEVLGDWPYRQWEYTTFGHQYFSQKPVFGKGVDFTVMSYNILAQNLLEYNPSLYTRCPSEALSWEYRAPRILLELFHHRPDIICLQEVQESQFQTFFSPELQKQGYEGHYIKRTGYHIDGCATFYNTAKFKLDKSVYVQYFNNNGGRALEKDNVALILRLEPIVQNGPSDRKLCVANTHLLFSPMRGDVKLAQVMVLLAELDRCARKNSSERYNYHPVIMCGDFNSEPHSDIYRLLLMAQLNYEGRLCCEISGQEEGFRRPSSVYLKKDFLPRSVGISDRCQYLHSSTGEPLQKPKLAQFMKNVDKQEPQGTGNLIHDFALTSAYEPTIIKGGHQRYKITTHHGRASCMVDYILYSIYKKETRFFRGEVQSRKVQEQYLNLIGTFGLISDDEMEGLGSLPNKKFASDHLSLLARFWLNL